MKRWTIITMCIFLSHFTSIFAQQVPQYTLYMLNPYNFNPSYAGLDNSLSATAVFRKQWVGFEGSPLTQNLNVHLPWYYGRGGIGMSIENDILGAERNTTISLSYAYQTKISETGWISGGIGAGIAQKVLDGTMLNPQNQDIEDTYIPLGKESGFAPIFSVGGYFKTDQLSIGISANNITQSSIDYQLSNVSSLKFLRNYFFIFAYNLEVNNTISLKPSLFIKSDLIETQGEISLILSYNNNIFGGASFRGYNKNTIDAISFLAGMKINENWTVAYAYDLSISPLKSHNSGSHEIVLNYNLNKILGGGKPPKIIYNPRFR